MAQSIVNTQIGSSNFNSTSKESYMQIGELKISKTGFHIQDQNGKWVEIFSLNLKQKHDELKKYLAEEYPTILADLILRDLL